MNVFEAHVGRTLAMIPASKNGLHCGAVDLGPILGIVEAIQVMDEDCPDDSVVMCLLREGRWYITAQEAIEPT